MQFTSPLAKLLCIFLLLLTGGSAGYFLRHNLSNPSSPRVQIKPSNIAVGNTNQGEFIKESVIIKNYSQESIDITKINRSCGCTEVKASSTTLRPNESSKLYITVDTSGKLGNITVYAGIEWKSQKNHVMGTNNVLISAKVTQIVKMSPETINLGQINAGSKIVLTKFTLTHEGSDTQWDDINLRSDGFKFTKSKLASGDFSVNAQFDPSMLPIGVYKPQIKLDLLNSNQNIVRTYTIPFQAEIVTNLTINPSYLYFSVLPTNAKRTGDISLQSSDSLRFESLNSSNPSLFKAVIEKNASNRLVFHYNFFSGGQTGNKSGILSLWIDIKGQRKNIIIPYIAYVKNS